MQAGMLRPVRCSTVTAEALPLHSATDGCNRPALHARSPVPAPASLTLSSRCLILVRPAAVLRRWTLDARYQRQLVRADDGGTIGLDYFRGAETADGIPIGAPVLLVLHGVTGAPLNPDSIP